MIYFSFAKEFGWLPKDIDRISNRSIAILNKMNIESSKKEIEDARKAASRNG